MKVRVPITPTHMTLPQHNTTPQHRNAAPLILLRTHTDVEGLSAEVVKGYIEDLGYTVSILENTLTPGNITLSVTVNIPERFSPYVTHPLTLKGMHCTSCVDKIESALKKIDGVDSAAANCMTMQVKVRRYTILLALLAS